MKMTKETFMARWEADIAEKHRQMAKIAAEKKREKEALEADNWGFIASRRRKRHWNYVRRYGRA